MLHGSAFNYKDKAIVIIGPSGSGKSESLNTIQNKNKIISDDILAIEFADNNALCLTGLSTLCIKSKNSLRNLDDKRQRSLEIIPDMLMVKNKLKISDIFFLNWGEANSICEIDHTSSFKQIILNSFRPIPTGACTETETFYMSSLTKLIANTEQYIFKRRRGNINLSVEKLYEFLNTKYD